MHQEVIKMREILIENNALNEASDSRKKKKFQEEKATGNGNAGRKWQLLLVLI